MRSNQLVRTCLALLAWPAYDVLAQSNPPQNERMTIPEAQQPQQPGQARPPQNRSQAQQPGATSAEPARKPPPPEEKTSVTHHSAHIAGQTIGYTATAATYVIKADDGTPKATFFFVAYTKDNVPDVARRPLSFVYNGGPGSASLFTHMGLGPRHVVLTPDGHGTPAPYLTEDNEDCFLDATDMVFVDAVSTGYSRPVPGENPTQFYGIIEDANIFSDFIYQYITRNDRWASPKYLIGESYGTTRSAELSGVLQERHEIYLNGIVLFSSVAFSSWGADDRTEYFLPTFTVTAWYHKMLPPDLQSKGIGEVAQLARDFAHGEYASALQKGDRLTGAEHAKIVQDLARFTALSPKYIEQTNLRVSPFRWFKELKRDQRLTVGRLDSRFTGMDVDAAGQSPEYDSSEASYEGAYVATFHDYVHRDLKWNSGDMYYTVSATVRPWDQTGDVRVAEVLRAAMTQQTYLKVLVVCGYYDVATPFNGIEHTFDHMNLEPSVRKNVSFAYYESGHMVYIDRKANDKLHTDITGFINANYQH
jgi:carboxypeptidase C (cathepsin A)